MMDIPMTVCRIAGRLPPVVWCFAWLLAGGCGVQARDQVDVVGKPVYGLEVETIDGQTLSLNDLRGKAVILPIWDTTCPPCIREFPGFIELYAAYRSRGLEIIGLTPALYEDADGIRAFVKKHGLTYPNAIVSRRELNLLGGIDGLPTTYIIDRRGVVRRRYLGYKNKGVFEQEVKEILDVD